MALTLAALTLLALCGSCLSFAAVGNLILRQLEFQMPAEGQQLLVSIAVGLLATEIFLFLIQTTQHIRTGCFALAVLLAALLLWEWRAISVNLRSVFASISAQSTVGKLLLATIIGVSFVEFLMSQAPLTGSDALHYHFTVQKGILEYGFHPLVSLSHSLLCGQHHSLILLGLALGSERLALGFIFLGGILTAASLTCLVSQWASNEVARIICLLFLLTPVVFWQISISGSPDIFMAFLACAATMVLCRERHTLSQVAVAGFLAGGIAGAKYIGCLIAAAFLVAVAFEFKSVMQSLLFAGGSLVSGIWPYLRNLVWTGDPVFPLLSARLAPHLVTPYELNALASDTGAATQHGFAHLLPFLLFAGTRQDASPGLWEFFGPLVLALAPLIVFGFRNTRPWRIPLLVWFLSGVGIFYSSGLTRFLLPVFPLALSCVAVGWQGARLRRWRIAQPIIIGLLVILGASGVTGLSIYSARPILAAIGMMSKSKYLEQSAPDYQVVEAINHILAGQDRRLRTLLFVRHLYYLDIPYLNGDPDSSFEVDPERLKTPEDWKRFFQQKGIGFVVRSPDYPEAIAAPLLEMEHTEELIPVDAAEVQNFGGNRISEMRMTIPVVVLKVRP
jgi:hypothetical protein